MLTQLANNASSIMYMYMCTCIHVHVHVHCTMYMYVTRYICIVFVQVLTAEQLEQIKCEWVEKAEEHLRKVYMYMYMYV